MSLLKEKLLVKTLPSIFTLYSPESPHKCLICNWSEFAIGNLYTHTELLQVYYGTFKHNRFRFTEFINYFDRVLLWSQSIDTIWEIESLYPEFRFRKYS